MAATCEVEVFQISPCCHPTLASRCITLLRIGPFDLLSLGHTFFCSKHFPPNPKYPERGSGSGRIPGASEKAIQGGFDISTFPSTTILYLSSAYTTRLFGILP